MMPIGERSHAVPGVKHFADPLDLLHPTSPLRHAGPTASESNRATRPALQRACLPLLH